ncbi:MAG: helix-turn-helix domain-containing protein [Chloroflexi bacterium]|nr:helix-turn-helix domain-containing protein [Chloroflexota bacterium]
MSKNDDKTRLISMGEAAELYGFSRYYLSELAKKGRLNAQKVGGRWLTTPTDVEDFIRSRQQKGVFRDDINLND